MITTFPMMLISYLFTGTSMSGEPDIAHIKGEKLIVDGEIANEPLGELSFEEVEPLRRGDEAVREQLWESGELSEESFELRDFESELVDELGELWDTSAAGHLLRQLSSWT
jgi:hypothetical protein